MRTTPLRPIAPNHMSSLIPSYGYIHLSLSHKKPPGRNDYYSPPTILKQHYLHPEFVLGIDANKNMLNLNFKKLFVYTVCLLFFFCFRA